MQVNFCMFSKFLIANFACVQFTEARSSKVKKILLPLLLALKLKLAIILPLVLKAITFISLKGLAVGTIALLFSGNNIYRQFIINI